MVISGACTVCAFHLRDRQGRVIDVDGGDVGESAGLCSGISEQRRGGLRMHYRKALRMC